MASPKQTKQQQGPHEAWAARGNRRASRGREQLRDVRERLLLVQTMRRELGELADGAARLAASGRDPKDGTSSAGPAAVLAARRARCRELGELCTRFDLDPLALVGRVDDRDLAALDWPPIESRGG